jgi:FtsZ-interacting cell division protein ZipA
VRRWRENMITEHCENELVFVHALIVRTWRTRGPRERSRYYERQERQKQTSERRERERRQAEHRRASERARKRALGRSSRPSRKQQR